MDHHRQVGVIEDPTLQEEHFAATGFLGWGTDHLERDPKFLNHFFESKGSAHGGCCDQIVPTGMTHDDADSPESELVGGAIQAHPTATAQANPITYITPDAPPFLVIHGDNDPWVPYGQSVIFVDALRQANVPVTFYTVRGGGHGGFNDPAILPLVDTFLHA